MTADGSQLLGTWRQISPETAPLEIYVTFVPDGRLLYSIEGGGAHQINLTWRNEGEALYTAQPDGAAEVARFRVEEPSFLILEKGEHTYRYQRI